MVERYVSEMGVSCCEEGACCVGKKGCIVLEGLNGSKQLVLSEAVQTNIFIVAILPQVRDKVSVPSLLTNIACSWWL